MHYKTHRGKLTVSYTDPLRPQSASQVEQGGRERNPENQGSLINTHMTSQDPTLVIHT